MPTAGAGRGGVAGTASGGAAGTGRSVAALLRDRTFGPYFAGNLTSNCGTWFQQLAAAIVVYDLTGSALAVGAVGAAQFLPSLVIAPWAGAVSDRLDRRRILIASQMVAAAAAGALAIWTAVGLPGAWPVLLVSLITGLGWAFSVPAMQALVPALVNRDDLPQAVAMNAVSFTVARAVGPALGAGTLVAFGAAAAFGINTLSYLVLIGALLVIRPRPVERRAGADASVRAGMRHVRGDPALVLLLVGVAALGFGADPVNTLTPPLAAELGGGDGLVGMLVSAFGVGAVLVAFLMDTLRRRVSLHQLSVGGLAVLGLGMAALSASMAPVAGLAALAVAGAGFLAANTALTTLIQQRVPEEFRGRVMALWAVAFLGSRPLAALLDGAVADLAGTRFAVVLAAAIVSAAAVLVGVGLRRAARPAL